MTANNTDYLTPDLVCDEFPGLTRDWLARQRWDHKPPTYIKAGRRVLYRRSDLEQFLTSCTVERS